ncbi:FAD-dependent monooxygenase [Streptomyces sioyaensis]|uniref:FAD-dependent oxidoreductase n=1 Tax=Streptomyces sioyaensis TaxID=67364 RepID=UPI0033CCE448
MPLRVLIAGAAVGGLALAQALRQAGIAVTVFERTPTVRADRRGYRINVHRVGGDALAACLPDELFRQYLATSRDEARARVAVFGHRMRPLYASDVGVDGTATPRDHTGVNRLTLRQVMVAGLEREVRFGQEGVRFEQTPDRVRVLLADGSTAEAVRPPTWPAGRVTLLGDAIHPMSPAGGTGANTALRDAAVLAGKLTAARRPAGPVSAVAAYETEMCRYGFAAVAESLRYGERFAQAIRHAEKETHR